MAKRLYTAKPQAIRAVDETDPERVRHWCPAALARAGPVQLAEQIAAFAVQAETQVDR